MKLVIYRSHAAKKSASNIRSLTASALKNPSIATLIIEEDAPMTLLDFRSVVFPYCLERQKDGTWVVLNREYKPVGFHTYTHIDYRDYPVAIALPQLNARLEKQLDSDGQTGKGRIYLYGDGSIPTHSAKDMKMYLNRLVRLAPLRTLEKRR